MCRGCSIPPGLPSPCPNPWPVPWSVPPSQVAAAQLTLAVPEASRASPWEDLQAQGKALWQQAAHHGQEAPAQGGQLMAIAGGVLGLGLLLGPN